MIDKKTKSRIYYRVYRRYKRASKRIGKPFNEIKLEGKFFKESLKRELAKERELSSKGEESRLKQSREIEGDVRFAPESRAMRRKEDYFSSPDFDPRELGGLGKIWGREDEPTREEEMKAIEKSVNEQLEAQRIQVCPYCKSSVCHCEVSENE